MIIFLILIFLFNTNVYASEINDIIEKIQNDESSNIVNDDALDENEEVEEAEQEVKYYTIKETSADRFVNSAILRGLNKTTGKTFKLKVKIGTPIYFERLEILPLKCWKSYPEETPENKILVKVFEKDLSHKTKKMIFFGWMFSSSPSISGIEHALYDITLVDCFNEEIIENNNENNLNNN